MTLLAEHNIVLLLNFIHLPAPYTLPVHPAVASLLLTDMVLPCPEAPKDTETAVRVAQASELLSTACEMRAQFPGHSAVQAL